MTFPSHFHLLPRPQKRLGLRPPSIRAAARRSIADQDRRLLERLLCDPRRDSSAEWSLTRLRALLRQARIHPNSELPKGTVRLGSSCAVYSEHLNETLRFVLTLPFEADAGRGRMSVLSPVGLAVLGRREGQECPALIPGGQGRFRLLRVSNHPRHGGPSPLQTAAATVC